jgi:IS30 family transposase
MEIDTIAGRWEKGEVLLLFDGRMSRKRYLVKIEGRTTKVVKKGL